MTEFTEGVVVGFCNGVLWGFLITLAITRRVLMAAQKRREAEGRRPCTQPTNTTTVASVEAWIKNPRHGL